jgi:hypothetical protein
MAVLNVAISAKALAILQGTDLGTLLSEATVEEDGSYTIAMTGRAYGQMRAAQAHAQHRDLATSFIRVADRKVAEEGEASQAQVR